MIIAIGSVIFGILLAGLFQVERRMLEEQRARRRAMILDAGRLVAAELMFLALPFAEPRPLATIGLGLAIFAFVVVPSSWAVNLGGIDPRWELRRLQTEGAELMERYPSPPPPEGAAQLEELMASLARVRSGETSELCDLLAARYRDWIAGSYVPLALGRRAIRIYDLQRRLYPDDTRAPRLSQDEATFRWRLYRVFGELVECGAQGSAERQERWLRLLRDLDAYRRPHTGEFIDSLQASIRAWLKRPDPKAVWRPSPHHWRGAAARGSSAPVWPDTSVFWGAILDESDRAQLRHSLATG